ncbi:extracellular solute-binding protein [Georgenia sp. AZ-5]|uniref:extracellular solute-binding protein n=1 Tax=Georgenia sp. AZ-5 TaxID=3367526 RepID=UPI00375446A7
MKLNVHPRRRRALAAAAGVAVLLAACGAGGDEGAETSPDAAEGGAGQEIRFLTHWGPDQVRELEAAAEAFNEEEPDITVTVQAVPFANLLSTLRTQAGSPGGPTVASIYDAWLPELVRDGVAAPAPDDVAQDVTANWPENVVSASSSDGQVYGFPNEIDLYALNYNTRLFEEAGLDGPPTTFDELASHAMALTDEAAGQQGFGVITNWASGAVHPFLSLAASNGGYLLDDQGRAALTDAKVVAVAQLYERMLADGSINPDMSAANANTTGPYLDNFANGKTGMIIMANWWQASLKEAMGDAYADVATAPVPVGPDGTQSSSISYSWLTMVNGNADDAAQEAAWKFLTYLNGPDSGEEGSSAMGDILIGMGILPSRQSDLDAHEDTLSDPFLQTYVDQLPNATPFPTVIGGDAASQAVQRHVEALVFGRESAQQAMDAATAEVDAALGG